MIRYLKICGMMAAFAAMLGAATPASAGIGDFVGSWRNIDPWTSGITRIDVSWAGPSHVFVHVWGECHPTDCNWGARPGREYTFGVNSNDVRTIAANFNPGFADELVILRRAPSGELSFEVLTHFMDGSGRRDFAQTGRLARW